MCVCVHDVCIYCMRVCVYVCMRGGVDAVEEAGELSGVCVCVCVCVCGMYVHAHKQNISKPKPPKT